MDDLKSTKEVPEDPLQEMTALLKRTQANFENFRKQTEKRVEEIRLMATKQILLEFLPVVDNLALALQSAQKDPSHVVEGIELIQKQLMDILQQNNVERLVVVGEQFNPHQHEALMKVVDDAKENTIIEELQSGYLLNGKVIRPAKVKISAGKKESMEDN